MQCILYYNWLAINRAMFTHAKIDEINPTIRMKNFISISISICFIKTKVRRKISFSKN